MHRIDNSTAVASMPPRKPAGTPGYYQGGNPAVGLKATIVEADALNAMMMEISNVIYQVGLPLDKNDDTQLVQSINGLIWQAMQADFAISAVPNFGYVRLAGGFMIQWLNAVVNAAPGAPVSTIANLPIAFPRAQFGSVVSYYGNAPPQNDLYSPVAVEPLGLSQLKFWVVDNPIVTSYGVMALALGY